MKSQMYILDPLFDFQCLCDTDIGLYRLIKKEYYDRSIFNNYLFDSTDERFVKAMLLDRKKFNPLFTFCQPGALSEDNMNDLYQQFMDEEYDKILKLSEPTSIMSVASAANSLNKMVNVTVLCNNEEEVNWLMKYNHKLKYIISNYKNFKLDKYDTIYIKDIYVLESFNQESINNKNIIISKFTFNLELGYSKIDMPILELTKKYYKNNKFMISDPYSDITIPVKEME